MKTTLVVAAVAVAAVTVAAVFGARGPGDPAEARAAETPWTFAAPMSQRRSYIAAAELDGHIYAAGGMVGETGRFLSVFQRFDPAQNHWTTLQPLPDPTRAAAGAALDGKVYVFGGQTAGGVTKRVLAYDVAKGEWEDRAPLPRPLFNEAAVAMDGKIYVLGGFSGGKELRTVYVYDPASDSWSESTPMPIPNHTFGAVVFEGGIWTFGGRRGEKTLRDVWIFDPADGEMDGRPRDAEADGAERDGGLRIRDPHHLGAHLPGLRRRDRQVEPGARATRPQARSQGLCDRRNPLHRGRLHDRIARLSGRGSEEYRNPLTFRRAGASKHLVGRSA